MIRKFLRLKDYIELHDRGDDRMDAQSGLVLYVNGGTLSAVDNNGDNGIPANRVQYVTQDLTDGSAPAPSERGHLAAHDGSGSPPSGLYESNPGSNQWEGIGLTSGNTISY